MSINPTGAICGIGLEYCKATHPLLWSSGMVQLHMYVGDMAKLSPHVKTDKYAGEI